MFGFYLNKVKWFTFFFLFNKKKKHKQPMQKIQRMYKWIYGKKQEFIVFYYGEMFGEYVGEKFGEICKVWGNLKFLTYIILTNINIMIKDRIKYIFRFGILEFWNFGCYLNRWTFFFFFLLGAARRPPVKRNYITCFFLK